MSAVPQTGRKRFPRPERRELLLDVAERLFVTQGYAGVTMEDLASAAGVTRPIVYSHFDSREGAYIACVRRAREQYNVRILATAEGTTDPKVQLERGAEMFFGLLESDPGRWRLLFASSMVLPQTHADELSALRFETIEVIAETLRRGSPHAPEVAVRCAAHAISGVGERLGLMWLADPSLSKDELVCYFVEFIWAGIQQYAGEVPVPGAVAVQ